MIQRINLIEAKPFTFTYLKLVQICAVVLFIASLFAGWQFAKVYMATEKLAEVRQQLFDLKNEEKRLQAKPVIQKVSVSQFPELFDRIIAAPKFSSVLNEISNSLPTSVRLITLGSSLPSSKPKTKAQQSTKDKDGDGNAVLEPKVQEKVDYTMRKIEITGLSSDAETMTDFVSNLEKTQVFNNPVITESHNNEFGYEFKITSEVQANVK